MNNKTVKDAIFYCLLAYSKGPKRFILVPYDYFIGESVRSENSMNFVWVENFPLFLPKEDGSGKIKIKTVAIKHLKLKYSF